jgi:hypothetical protein
MPQHANIVATWSDTKHVHIWDVSSLLSALDSDGIFQSVCAVVRFFLMCFSFVAGSKKPAAIKPLRSHRHPDEGFALAWSHLGNGQLLSGDCTGNIFHWSESGGSIAVDPVRPSPSLASLALPGQVSDDCAADAVCGPPGIGRGPAVEPVRAVCAPSHCQSRPSPCSRLTAGVCVELGGPDRASVGSAREEASRHGAGARLGRQRHLVELVRALSGLCVVTDRV